MKKFMIAGTKSGCGKTSVTCGVLSALKDRGYKISSFKCGPDYIDPMFHRQVIGIECHNLDSYFCDPVRLSEHFYRYADESEICIAEGVMGFYDGGEGSAYCISELLEIPVIIVIDCKGMSESAGAVMKGFLDYKKPNRIAGFIFNRLSPKLADSMKKICSELGTEYFGFFPESDVVFKSRYLGLVTAEEVEGIRSKVKELGRTAEKFVLLDKFTQNLSACTKKTVTEVKRFSESPVIAVAKDRAFCFQYAENIELLEEMGCRIRCFSPLNDKSIPECDGLILCGGYPELYAEKLSENSTMRESIKSSILNGLPVIAECGGFMYLHSKLTDSEHKTWEMAGVFEGEVFYTNRLQRFGYIEMSAEKDCMLCRCGEKIRSHEFHRFESTDCGDSFTAVKPDGRTWKCCHADDSIYAGFPHLYFSGNTSIAENFVKKCIEYRGRKWKG